MGAQGPQTPSVRSSASQCKVSAHKEGQVPSSWGFGELSAALPLSAPNLAIFGRHRCLSSPAPRLTPLVKLTCLVQEPASPPQGLLSNGPLPTPPRRPAPCHLALPSLEGKLLLRKETSLPIFLSLLFPDHSPSSSKAEMCHRHTLSLTCPRAKWLS